MTNPDVTTPSCRRRQHRCKSPASANTLQWRIAVAKHHHPRDVQATDEGAVRARRRRSFGGAAIVPRSGRARARQRAGASRRAAAVTRGRAVAAADRRGASSCAASAPARAMRRTSDGALGAPRMHRDGAIPQLGDAAYRHAGAAEPTARCCWPSRSSPESASIMDRRRAAVRGARGRGSSRLRTSTRTRSPTRSATARSQSAAPVPVMLRPSRESASRVSCACQRLSCRLAALLSALHAARMPLKGPSSMPRRSASCGRPKSGV
jgi:hypothetical protein